MTRKARPSLKLVSSRPAPAPTELETLKKAVSVAAVLLEVATANLKEAQAAIAALEAKAIK